MTQLIKSDLVLQSTAAGPIDEPFSLVGLFARLLRRLPLFAGIAIVIFALNVAHTLTTKPSYTATASVVIKHQMADVLTANLPQMLDHTDSTGVDTEVGKIMSRPLSVRVAQELRLDRDPEFNGALAPPHKRFGIFPPKAKPVGPVNQADLMDGIASAMISHLKVRRSGLTFQIDISFTSENPEKAARIANAITEEYLNEDVEAKYASVHRVSEFVDARLQALGKELEANEAAVQQYKISHNLVASQGATMAEQDLSSLNAQIATSRADLAEKQARLSSARDQMTKGNGGDVAAALGSQVIQKLREQRADLLRQQAEFAERYGPLHPKVTQVQRQLGENQKQIQEEIDRIMANLEAEVRISQQRAASLTASRGSAQGSLGSNSQAMVGLNDLQRKADASRTVYEQFLNRSKASGTQEELQTSDARIISPALKPLAPSKPNKPLGYALGFVMAMAGGIVGMLLAENLDTGMLTSKDVETKLQLPCIGAIPLLPKSFGASKMDYVLQKPFSGFAEALRGLRTALRSSNRPIKIVTIASALPDEGKTLTVASLGRVSAQAGVRTLVMDCDLRRRQLTRSFDRPVQYGLIEVLSGEVSLDQALILDEPSGAYMLLLSGEPAPTTDFVGGPAFPALLKTLRERFEFVVIDTAPVLALAETRIVAAESDATIFLARWTKTSKNDAQAALELLMGANATVAGVCLTQVDMAKQSFFGYGDKMYNYKKYRNYYVG